MKHSDIQDKRIIGIDIDGVLTHELVDGVNIWQREVEAYFPGLELVEPSFAFTTAYGISAEKAQEFMENRAEKIFAEVPPQTGAKHLLDRLMSLDFTVHLITARQSRYSEVTKNWLKKHKLPYTGLWFQESKGVLCHSLGVEVFVDDYWENCIDIQSYGIVTLLMSAHHNLACTPQKGIHRVENWREIEKFIAGHYDLERAELRSPGA
ncbi:MAG: hypothetical protein GX316_10315 [Firmicutes bacterium]|nr:hypothetical protein [Bacillota bacterium]